MTEYWFIPDVVWFPQVNIQMCNTRNGINNEKISCIMNCTVNKLHLRELPVSEDSSGRLSVKFRGTFVYNFNEFIAST